MVLELLQQISRLYANLGIKAMPFLATEVPIIKKGQEKLLIYQLLCYISELDYKKYENQYVRAIELYNKNFEQFIKGKEYDRSRDT